MENRRVAVGMSGGVDSSVAVYLLQQQGYDCLGVTMRLYRNEEIGRCEGHTCCSRRDIDDAWRVAGKLQVPYEVADLTARFRREVMDRFVEVYEQGGTPNPCIDCNRYLKFGAMLEWAVERGCSHIATGHYARVVYDGARGRYVLKKALDASKDQSYALYTLTQQQLARVLLPLGELRKSEVRAIAEEQGFVNAHKHDSQDICFVPDGDYVRFLEEYTGETYPAGDFLDREGNVIGRHRGAVGYTLGQRRGLGLPMGERVYVCGKDMAKNTVTVGPEEALFSRGLIAEDMNWISIESLTAPMEVRAKTRYSQREQEAVVSPLEGGRVRVEFRQPQRAVTAGQAVVLYDGDTVVGGGTIREAEK